jgi:transcriptional regulator with XRE-family HTH domain
VQRERPETIGCQASVAIVRIVDDRTVGLIVRALRRRRKWRQVDLARASETSQALISRVERGHVAELTVQTLRTIFLALEARLGLAPTWRGAELERLLDQDHASTVAMVARRLEEFGWTVALEVTYSEYGERGSIDVLGLEPGRRAAIAVEVKTDIASAEAMGRKLDEKARLTPRIVRERFGWTPVIVGRVIALPDTERLRRLVERQPVIARMFPAGSRQVRAWLRNSEGVVAGLWFLSNISLVNARALRRPPNPAPPRPEERP